MPLTPGQVNFEAFMQGLEPPGQLPWQWLGAAEQAAWEAAAQAVLDAWQAQSRLETPC